MLKSMHVIGSLNLGGAESFYARLVNSLSAANNSSIALIRPNSRVREILAVGVKHYEASMRNKFDLLTRWKVKQLIQRENPQIIQTYMTRATVCTHIKKNAGPVHIARLGGYYKLKRFAHAHAWVGNTKGICDYLIRGCWTVSHIPGGEFYIAGKSSRYQTVPGRHPALRS